MNLLAFEYLLYIMNITLHGEAIDFFQQLCIYIFRIIKHKEAMERQYTNLKKQIVHINYIMLLYNIRMKISKCIVKTILYSLHVFPLFVN